MANPWAGEVELVIDGRREVMRLTLGALAELETGLGESTLFDLVERFEAGRFSTRDVVAVIVAGLRGGGRKDAEAGLLLEADIQGGPIAAAQAAAQLIVRAFSLPEAPAA